MLYLLEQLLAVALPDVPRGDTHTKIAYNFLSISFLLTLNIWSRKGDGVDKMKLRQAARQTLSLALFLRNEVITLAYIMIIIYELLIFSVSESFHSQQKKC